MTRPLPLAAPCRCGAPADASPHPCHGRAYTCRAPAQQRFYAPRIVSLAGYQPKVGIEETWACEECWAKYAGLLAGCWR